MNEALDSRSIVGQSLAAWLGETQSWQIAWAVFRVLGSCRDAKASSVPSRRDGGEVFDPTELQVPPGETALR